MQARRCVPGIMTMPGKSTVRPMVRARTGCALTIGDTRVPLTVIATGTMSATQDNLTRYQGVTYMPGQRFQIDPLDLPEFVKAGRVQVIEDLPPVNWWGMDGRILMMEPGAVEPCARARSAGALTIAQGTGYDPGNAAYRFHTAINEHTKHASAFVRYITRANNPFGCPTQIDALKNPTLVRALLLDADVVHCHIDPILTVNVGLGLRPRQDQLLIRHYHGTQFTHQGKQLPDDQQVPRQNAALDDANGYVLVGARLTLCALRPERIQWLPITVPVDRYRAMAPIKRDEWPRTPFRVAHSPTKSILKGTREFLQVCKRLNARGVPIQPVLIERKHHDAALVLKASCDACFDSFALGIQGSGLEAAAMGQPVIAGDADVAALYRHHLGSVPYTYAPTWQTLEAALERLAMDQAFYTAEATRVGTYVREVHDYPAVARRYEDILATALGRPNVRTKPRKRRAA